jgi:transcriptional regulator GlxA family with amidase domain
MESNHNASLLLQHKVKKVIEILVRNVDSIPDVQCWAKEAGVSRRWLCKSMKEVHGKPPKIILREVKFEKVVKLISGEGLNASCYSVAVDAGFKKSKNVSAFLSSYYDTNFTSLKMDLLNDEIQINFLWLNGAKE